MARASPPRTVTLVRMDGQPANLTFVRDLNDRYETRQQHARAVRLGREERVATGVYLPIDDWTALGGREQHVLRARAVVATRRVGGVVSHGSAAAFWQIPLLGLEPQDVHLTVPPATGGRSYPGVAKHCLPLSTVDIVEVDGFAVTSLARTLIDLAATEQFLPAVVAIDAAIRKDRFARSAPLVSKAELESAHARRMPFTGHVRALEAVNFADERVDSPLESVSRVSMRTIGCPKPVLQQRFDDYLGLIGFSEFHWPEFGLVGEADGRSKYTDPRYRRERTLEQVLLDEKERADRLRAIGQSVSRWGWATAIDPEKLRRHLAAAGLPTGGRW